MAQDLGSEKLNHLSDADLDQLEVRILVVCKTPKNLGTSGSFLTKRGWPTTTLTSAAPALEYIQAHRPNIVLISFSHSDPAVLNLARSLDPSLNVTCIGFVETTDLASNQKLQDANLAHKISEPPSGPNLHRAIRKILGERPAAAPALPPELGANEETAATVQPTPAPRLIVSPNAPATLLQDAVEAALRRVTVVRLGVNPRPIGTAERAAVFAFKDGPSAGYLVLGMEAGLFRQGEFLLPAVEMALKDEFKLRQITGALGSGLWVELPAVGFEEWTKRQAQFTVTMPHEFSNLTIAYFSLDGAPPEPRLHSEAKQMFAFGVDDMSADHPTNFQAFVHLPLNNKYFLYLREGRILQPEQKARLKERRIHELYRSGSEVERVRAYVAGAYFKKLLKAGD